MENERFGRTRALLGEEKFGRLQGASVMVVGLGAVGGYALEALARAGIGHLILVDFDIVEPSNLNRQILALHSTLGRKKSELAAEPGQSGGERPLPSPLQLADALCADLLLWVPVQPGLRGGGRRA